MKRAIQNSTARCPAENFCGFGLNAWTILAAIVLAAVPLSLGEGAGDADMGDVWQSVRMRVTAYCPCEKCCGEYSDGITANGHKIRPGDTFVAADKAYPFGTKMVIGGYNNSMPVEVLDRGGAITAERLDVFFGTHEEALQWGVRYLDVKVRIQN